MFTGLIEEVGSVSGIGSPGEVTTLEILAPELSPSLKDGQSVSVMGACLTVVSHGKASFKAEMMEETVARTKLGKLKPGDRVNLERAMQLGGRLDGHLVTGHIDGLCTLTATEGSGRTRRMTFSADTALVLQIVPKGSVALDGVSLTVIDSDAPKGLFSVGLIPETLRRTTLGQLSRNAAVNLETDIIAKYVRQLLTPRAALPEANAPLSGISWEMLQQEGWL
jgi:riboflavin synthase